jgi:hypothetical protein
MGLLKSETLYEKKSRTYSSLWVAGNEIDLFGRVVEWSSGRLPVIIVPEQPRARNRLSVNRAQDPLPDHVRLSGEYEEGQLATRAIRHSWRRLWLLRAWKMTNDRVDN